MKTLKTEPVMVGVLAFVGATVALLVAFGVHVTADQREAIEGWVGAAITLGLFVRSRVMPMVRAHQTPDVTPPPLPPAPEAPVDEHPRKSPAAVAVAPATVIADAPARLP